MHKGERYEVQPFVPGWFILRYHRSLSSHRFTGQVAEFRSCFNWLTQKTVMWAEIYAETLEQLEKRCRDRYGYISYICVGLDPFFYKRLCVWADESLELLQW